MLVLWLQMIAWGFAPRYRLATTNDVGVKTNVLGASPLATKKVGRA